MRRGTKPPTDVGSASAPTATRRRHRVRVPSVFQLEATECGAASLAMVLAHHGRFVPLETLRTDCGVSRDGSSARSLLTAARKFGMTSKAFSCEPDVLKTKSFPLIVHWNFFHFVVVEGWFEGGWYLNDPATGPRPCSDQEFDENFTGIVIEAVPSASFAPGGKRPGVARRLMATIGNSRAAIALIATTALLLVAPVIAVPQLMRSFGDTLGDIGHGLGAGATLTGLVFALVVMAVVLAVQGVLAVRMATRISQRLSGATVDRLLRLPAMFHAQRGAAVTTQRARVAERLSDSVTIVLVTVLTRALTASIALAVLITLNPISGATTLALGALVAWLAHMTLRRSHDLAASLIVNTIEAGAVVSASLNQIESIKASGNDDGMISLGRARQTRLLVAQQNIGVRSTALRTLSSALGPITTSVVALVTAAQVTSGHISTGSYLAVVGLSALVIGPTTQIVAALDHTQMLRASLDHVDDVLEAPLGDDHRQLHDDAPHTLRGHLTLHDVSFGYNTMAPAIVSNLDLDVPPGHRIAIVGPTGCGKSTVSRLVAGLYEPWSGKVLIDGIDRSRHHPLLLTEQFALVDQDVTIFSGTIRDNVTLWDATVPESDIVAAIRDAQLADDVEQRPGGLDAVLDEGGSDLSGGQRQRLEIARALVRNPRLLVLDEATSALDPLTEQSIDEAIRRRGIACLIIAHRLSTIRDCDEILVLDRGTVVERGRHDDLLARGGAYAALVASL